MPDETPKLVDKRASSKGQDHGLAQGTADNFGSHRDSAADGAPRPSALKYGEFDLDPETYKRTPNRLANAHFKLGHDLGDEGTSERDKDWVNVKLEVVEGPPPVPDQKGQLNLNGPEIRMNCAHCKQPLRIGGSKRAKEALEEGGFTFDPYKIVLNASDEVAACICPNGHVTQLRMEFAMQLRK